MKAKHCPTCAAPHGRSLFALANSGKATPIRCARCGASLYFSGWLRMLLLSMVLPVAGFSGRDFPVGLALFCGYGLVWLLVVWLSEPKVGPVHG
jgi:hypothetical protein